MSLPIALQSVVFYFAACTPCRAALKRRQQKEMFEAEKAQRTALEMEQPSLYLHPAPFTTNPYWQEEINRGPSLPKKSASKNSSARGLNSSGKDSEAPRGSKETDAPNESFADSSTAVPESEAPDDLNKRTIFQRADEELWGEWSGHRIKDAFSKAKDSAGRLMDPRLFFDKEVTDEERREFYQARRVPPVNDYHPPVVSNKAPIRAAHQWMLQPPPPAKVMEGKVPVSRNVSSGSRSSGRTTIGDENSLARQVSERLLRERTLKGRNPTEEELIESLLPRTNRSLSFPRTRSLSLDGLPEDLEEPYAEVRSTHVRIEVEAKMRESQPQTPAPRAARRPGLRTIAGSRSNSGTKVPRSSMAKNTEPSATKGDTKQADYIDGQSPVDGHSDKGGTAAVNSV